MKYLIFAFCIYSVISLPTNNWGLLVAGSHIYLNYRHQSDIFHSYQILKEHGVPEDHIIVMAYDDIAEDEDNPFPGKVFNRPDPEPLEVYHGVKIDYKGDDVTSKNFLAILKGDKDSVKGGNGRVIESTSEDNIFVYFSDHGGSEILCFPVDYLYADQLNDTINFMYEHKKYHQMVFYVDACYSGSMFDGILLPSKNVYATTASSPKEESWTAYCNSTVYGKSFDTCLGDEYSVAWMENSDIIDVWTTTLGQQKDTVSKITLLSHVMEYGDLSLRDELVGLFQGHKKPNFKHFLGVIGNDLELNKKEFESRASIPSSYAKLYYLKKKAERTGSIKDQDNYLNEIKKYERTYKIFKLFREKFDLDNQNYDDKVNYDCYRTTVEMYDSLCGIDVNRDIGFFKYLHQFCSLKKSTREAYNVLNEICHSI